MKVLITGVEGFVGRYLLKEVRANSAPGDVIFGIGCAETEPDELPGLHQYTCLDITDFGAFNAYLTGIEPDVIYHLAAQSSVAISLEKPVETFRVNQMGTLYLLETAVKDLGCQPRILLVGSADIYRAAPNGTPLAEDAPLQPLNPYSASKAAADFLGAVYGKQYGLTVLRTRSFNHIGPGQRPVFVMSSFARQIARIERHLQEGVLSVGNLNVRRDFTDVRDVARAYRLLIERGVPGEAYNVCSGKAVAISEMLEMLLGMTAAKIDVRRDPGRMRKSDNPVLVGNGAKIAEHTGWKPEIPLHETLENLLDYWRERVENEIQ